MDSTHAAQGTEGLINGSNGAAEMDPGAMPVTVGEEQPEAAAAVAAPATSYDDLFPSLPASAPPATASAAPIGEWNRKPLMFASSTVTQVFRIPVEERKGANATAANNANAGGSANGNSFGSEDSYRSLKNVMDKTGAKIEMSSARDQSLTFLITGKQDVVLKAKRELLNQFQTQGNQVVSIPKEHHRFILGKGGSRLQELEAKTATKISMPKANDASDKITITGTKEGIEKAIHEIRVTSDEQVIVFLEERFGDN